MHEEKRIMPQKGAYSNTEEEEKNKNNSFS